MKKIIDVAKKLGLEEQQLYLYGMDQAKIIDHFSERTNSKTILVTAINPTPHGEGKTTISIGLNDALCQLQKKSIAVLREPSLGPVFGMKGGATGGGKASLVPSQAINLHFTGDFHAITSANNLLCAAVYNHIYQGNELKIDSKRICIKRCMDMNDRELRNDFNITAASEVMAIFCLARDRTDLRRRLGHILVAYNQDGLPVYAKDLKVDGAMMLLLSQALYPNLVQTLEENPVFVHGGPFANIAHGCNSVIAAKLGSSLADYVVTEAGFGSDLGAEKYLDIHCRETQKFPSAIVLVTTVQALLHSGFDNLQAHIDHLKEYHIPFCVTINHFLNDKSDDVQKIVAMCEKQDIPVVVSDPFYEGGKGCLDLARLVIELSNQTSQGEYLYDIRESCEEKMNILATKVYHAKQIIYSDLALQKLKEIKRLGVEHFPICVAKTPYSISDDAQKLGYPQDYILSVRDIVIQTGSEMIIILLNNIITMPGLPKHPNYLNME